MAEWSNAADSKSVIGLVSIWGSNPHLSATFYTLRGVFFMGMRSPDTGVRSQSASEVDAKGGPERTNEVSNPHLLSHFLHPAGCFFYKKSIQKAPNSRG